MFSMLGEVSIIPLNTPKPMLIPMIPSDIMPSRERFSTETRNFFPILVEVACRDFCFALMPLLL